MELKNRLDEKESEEKAKTKKATRTINIDKEKDLIETIERIKSKLRRSITKKVQEERKRQYRFYSELCD